MDVAQVRATGGSVPRGPYLIAPLTGTHEGIAGLMVSVLGLHQIGYQAVSILRRSMTHRGILCQGCDFRRRQRVVMQEFRPVPFRCTVVVGTIFVSKLSQLVNISTKSHREVLF